MIKALSISEVGILSYSCMLASKTISLEDTFSIPLAALSAHLLILSKFIDSSLPLRFLTFIPLVIIPAA
jgi:hypothetical protein